MVGSKRRDTLTKYLQNNKGEQQEFIFIQSTILERKAKMCSKDLKMIDYEEIIEFSMMKHLLNLKIKESQKENIQISEIQIIILISV